jgi:hypothetical protein
MTPDRLANLANIHDRTAADLPPLSHLSCDECGKRDELTTFDAANYLRSGWPVHCGHTMRLVTVKEAAVRAVQRRT